MENVTIFWPEKCGKVETVHWRSPFHNDGHLSTAATSSLPKVAVVEKLNFISVQVFLFVSYLSEFKMIKLEEWSWRMPIIWLQSFKNVSDRPVFYNISIQCLLVD